MSYQVRDNNQQQLNNTTFSGISFTNPDSRIEQTKFSIAYFNKLMKISIARRTGDVSNEFASFDNANATSVYVSNTKAKILAELMRDLEAGRVENNVCIELKGGLLKVSNGKEFGSDTYCFTISTSDKAGNVTEIVYQCKDDFYKGAYNYQNGKFNEKVFPAIEFDTFLMTLDQYYLASSYAIAATVMEASMYKRNGQYQLCRSIAEKLGVVSVGGNHGSGGNYNSKTFLSNNPANQTGGMNGAASEEYDTQSFDELVSQMGLG